MQGCVQHFCHFSVFSANVLIPDCINAIQFLQYPLQTLFESKSFVVTALFVKMRLPRSAERILNRPTQKEKGLLRITRNSPF